MTDVAVCFEINAVDTPIFRGVKTYARAMSWRDEDIANRYFVLCAVDAEAEPPEALPLFEAAGVRV